MTAEAEKYLSAAKPDWAGYVKHYHAEDAAVLTPNAPPVKGRAALEAFFASFPPVSSFKPEIVDIDGRGDVAYVHGTYAMTFAPAGAPPVTDTGKYLEVWKKQAEGGWKSAYDSFSSDLPDQRFVVPTGTVAGNASDAVRRLGELVGRWRFSGTLGPAGDGAPMDMTFTAAWFAGGQQLVFQWDGSVGQEQWKEIGACYYDPRTKAYAMHFVNANGSAGGGPLSVAPGLWIFTYDGLAGDKPAKFRFTLSDMSASGGTWTYEVAVAGGPWTPAGEGKYAKAE